MRDGGTASTRVRDPHTLRAYVRLLRLSERTLADRAGVSHATVSQVLSGRRASCTPATAHAIVRVLRCPGEVFFEPFAGPPDDRSAGPPAP